MIIIIERLDCWDLLARGCMSAYKRFRLFWPTSVGQPWTRSAMVWRPSPWSYAINWVLTTHSVNWLNWYSRPKVEWKSSTSRRMLSSIFFGFFFLEIDLWWCGLSTKTKTKPSCNNLCSLVLTDFLLGWRRPNLITGLSGCQWGVPDWPRRTQETVPDCCQPSLIRWSFSIVKTKSLGVSKQHHASVRYPVECGTVLNLYIEHTPHQDTFKFPLNDWYDHDKQHNVRLPGVLLLHQWCNGI